jgi:hypothetical protein
MGRLERIIGTNIISLASGEEIRLGHTWHEIDTLSCIIEIEKPEWFVEVGLHEGGLSYMLIPQYPDLKYFGIELEWTVVRQEVRQVYVDCKQTLHLGDCFDARILEKVKSLPHKIIYCDGGNKVAEVIAYKHVCNPGDIIFCHDYHDGKRVVREVPKQHIHPEVLPKDVEHMNVSPVFEPYSEGYLKETRIVGWRRL